MWPRDGIYIHEKHLTSIQPASVPIYLTFLSKSESTCNFSFGSAKDNAWFGNRKRIVQMSTYLWQLLRLFIKNALIHSYISSSLMLLAGQQIWHSANKNPAPKFHFWVTWHNMDINQYTDNLMARLIQDVHDVLHAPQPDTTSLAYSCWRQLSNTEGRLSWWSLLLTPSRVLCLLQYHSVPPLVFSSYFQTLSHRLF